MEVLVRYIFNTFVSVFVIVDPFSVTPIYLTLTKKLSADAVRKTRNKATIIALCLLLGFALTGMGIFKFFGITLPAFQIAGGILLLVLGIAQLNASRDRVNQEEEDESLSKEDISVFPLATPLLAGPGAISAVVLQGSRADSASGVAALCIAIAAAMLATLAILKSAPLFYRLLGQTGLNLLTRLMGIILTAIAVQYILDGISGAILHTRF